MSNSNSSRLSTLGIATAVLGVVGYIILFTSEVSRANQLFLGLGASVLLIIGAAVILRVKKPENFSNATLGATGLALFFALLSGFGYANEWWSTGTAFTMLRYATFGAIGLIFVNAAGAIISFKAGETMRGGASAVALIACVTLGVMMQIQISTARSVPPIHDATTDLDNIPQYAVLAPDNPNNDNWRELHEAGYPDLKPLTVEMSVADVIAKAESASKGFGWDVAVADQNEGRLEVTETTTFFRFKDDLVLRVRDAGNGRTTIDARSVSRFAGSDIGVNAARIKRLFAAIQQ